MKHLLIAIFFVSFAGKSQDLNEIRQQYPKAAENAEITNKLDGILFKVNSEQSTVLLTYKGAVLTLKAKFAKSRKDKKDFFKEGVSLIESAVKRKPNNIEIRYIRMSVQENSPRFLGYHKNIEEDKQFILKHYALISSTELKDIIKDFVLKSENFNELEKELDNKT